MNKEQYKTGFIIVTTILGICLLICINGCVISLIQYYIDERNERYERNERNERNERSIDNDIPRLRVMLDAEQSLAVAV